MGKFSRVFRPHHACYTPVSCHTGVGCVVLTTLPPSVLCPGSVPSLITHVAQLLQIGCNSPRLASPTSPWFSLHRGAKTIPATPQSRYDGVGDFCPRFPSALATPGWRHCPCFAPVLATPGWQLFPCYTPVLATLGWGTLSLLHPDSHYWLRDKVEKKVITPAHLPTEEMPANLLTKPLAKPKVEKFRMLMGLMMNT